MVLRQKQVTSTAMFPLTQRQTYSKKKKDFSLTVLGQKQVTATSMFPLTGITYSKKRTDFSLTVLGQKQVTATVMFLLPDITSPVRADNNPISEGKVPVNALLSFIRHEQKENRF